MPLKVALAGLGHMGKIHFQKLASMGRVQFVGVADPDEERARPICLAHSIPFYGDFRDLVGAAQAVVIATPTQSHYEIARTFLKAGAHVFIEKPMTADAEEARDLIGIAKQKGLTIQVGHLERFNPAFQAAFRQITRPIYVETHRLSPFPNRSVDIDVVLDLMIHDIDLVLSLIKSPVTEVRAQGMPFLIDKVDAASARILFADKAVASLHASRVSVKRERALTVFERDRYFVVDLLHNRLTVSRKRADGGMETSESTLEKGDAVHEELTEFVTSIIEGQPPSVKGDDGLKALEVADAITSYIARNTNT
jgi:predicted dehydrogenase